MTSWVPLNSELPESSLWQTPLHVRVAWVSLFSQMDFRTFQVRTNRFRLARLANITVEQAEEALLVLTSPDPETLTQEHEGRRLLKMDGEGYFFVNGPKYQALMRRRMNAIRQAEFRARAKARRLKQTPLTNEAAAVKAHQEGDTERAERLAEPVGPGLPQDGLRGVGGRSEDQNPATDAEEAGRGIRVKMVAI